jgi:signal transduction histidine kinase
VHKVFAIIFSIALTWAGCTGKESQQKKQAYAQEIDSLVDTAFALQYNNAYACDSIAQIVYTKSQETNYKKGIANAWFLRSAAQQQFGNYDSAIDLAFKSLAVFIELNDDKGKARVYNDLGIDYDFKASYAKSIRYYLKALEIFEKLEDARGISNALNNIGLVYQNQKRMGEARGYHQRALDIAEKNNLEGAVLNAKNSLGSVFMELGDYDSALFFHQQVLDADLESGNKSYISYSYNNIGEAYLKKKEYDTAIAYFEKSKKLKKELGNRRALANTLMNLGEAYIVTKNYDEAKRCLNKALIITTDIDLPEKRQEIFELLHRLAFEKGNYKQSLVYFKEVAKIRRVINHDKKMAEISRLEKNYEVEKAQRITTEAESKARRIKQLAVIYGSVAIALLILLGSLWVVYRQKKKTNVILLDYQKELENKNQELEIKNKLVLAQKKEVENALAARSRFLSFMSHEIRTPLNGITGLVDLLQAMSMLPEQKEYMEALKLSSDNLLLLLNNILDLSRLEVGKIELEKRTVNIPKYVTDQVTLFKASAVLKGVELNFDIDKNIPSKLEGDGYRISQILTNLINNAIKFTRGGRVRVECNLVESKDNIHTVRFAVVDNGIGISKEKLKTIVEPFSQAEAHTTRKYGGTGLGLAIVQLLLNAMGSTLEIESEPKKGSTFFFTLNLPTYETPILSEEGEEVVISDTIELAGKKVLVVEDNKTNVLVLTNVLSNWKIKYDVANNGFIAIELAENNKYDIILMDLHLPKITGYETAYRIKTASSVNSKTPILAVTAADESEIEQNPHKQYLDSVMFKPVQTQVLLDNINKLLA